MQLPTDTALAAAVDAPNRVVVSKFEVDWGRDGTYSHALSDLSSVCDDISLTRDVAGSLPQEASLVEGFVGAQLAVTLSGLRATDTQSIMQALSPLRTDSPLFGSGRIGAPARWRLGLQTAAGTVPMIDQFTGYVSSCHVTSDGNVELVCLDTDRLHTKINLPVFALDRPGTTQNPGGKFRINSQWVIDYILRRNGIYQSPPMMPGCIYSATGHGSMIPERGHNFELQFAYGTVDPSDACSVPGRWGLAYNGTDKYSSNWIGRANAPFNPTIGSSWTIQCQVKTDLVAVQRNASSGGNPLVILCTGQSTFATNSISFVLRIDTAGRLFADFYTSATLVMSIGGPTLPATGWQNVILQVDVLGANRSNSAVSFPNQTTSGVNLSGLVANPVVWDYAHVTTGTPVAVQNLQICNATGLAAGSTTYDPTTFVPQCDLDPGLNEFYSLPVRRGKDSLELLREVIGAEFGVAGFTESGRFFFKNRNSAIRGNLTTEKTANAQLNLTQLGASEKTGSIRNVVTATVKSFTRADKYKTMWESASVDEIVVPKGTSNFSLVLDRPGTVEDFLNLLETNTTGWNTVADLDDTHRYVPVLPGFVEVTGLTVSVFLDPVSLESGVDRVTVRVTCPYDTGTRFATTDGRPALQIGGQFAESDPPQQVVVRRQSSIDRYGEQTYEIPESEWLQLFEPVQALAVGLLRDLKSPVPLLDRIRTVGDPRLQLLDTIEVSDVVGVGGPVLTSVQLLVRTWSKTEGLTDELVVRPFTYPGRWILGHPQYSILGLTTILG